MFAHASVPPSNNTTGQTPRAIPAGLTLPPPALLWEWLSYIYRTTGEWWRPPVTTDITAEKPAALKEYSRPTEPIILSAKAATTKGVARTGFSYASSPYYEEAGKLMGQAANFENYAECRLTLSFIIAWSRFSLFANLPVDGADWMALSFGRCACELKMRASKFKVCLAELERAGLIRLAGFSEGLLSASTQVELQSRRNALTGEAAGLWNAHFFQKQTTLYLLNVTVAAALPEFKPFTESLTTTGKTSEMPKAEITNPASLSQPFLLNACKNESNNENYDIFDVNEADLSLKTTFNQKNSQFDKLESAIQRLNSQGKSIYDFISLEARFEGFCRQEDGRETLDTREALKFATGGRYTLEQVKTRYEQVKEVWESLSGCHNPLALLHWTLTQDVDPRRGKPKGVKEVKTGRASYEANRSSSRPYSRPQLSYQKRMFPPARPGVSDDFTEAAETEQASPAIFAQPAPTAEPEKLWKVVCEDLAGRFRLAPVKHALLKDSALHFEAENSGRVEVVLRSIWEERQLDGLTRNVINLALRQRLGPGLEVTFLSA